MEINNINHEANISTFPRTCPIVQNIDKKLHSLTHSMNGDLPLIFRVHHGLRRSNPQAYTPMLVSIGLYHHANPNLLPLMDDIKLSCLHYFLARRQEESVERYVVPLQGLKHKSLSCYANLNDDDHGGMFLEMMLLDGCFVVEFVRRYSELEHDVSSSSHDGKDDHDPIFGVDWMRIQVCRDLMLLENQLPYFVLSKLYHMNETMNDDDDDDADHGKEPFANLAMLVFPDMFPKLSPASVFSSELIKEERGIKHLLHLIHLLSRPVMNLKSLGGNSVSGSEVMDPMHCVKELEEAGIKFKKIGKVYAGIHSLDADSVDDRVSLFDIKFSNGLMEIP